MTDKITPINSNVVENTALSKVSTQKEAPQNVVADKDVKMLGLDEDSKLDIHKPKEEKMSKAEETENAQKDASAKIFQEKKIMALAKDMGYEDAILTLIQKSTKEIVQIFEESLSQSTGNIDSDYKNAIQQFVSKTMNPQENQG